MGLVCGVVVMEACLKVLQRLSNKEGKDDSVTFILHIVPE